MDPPPPKLSSGHTWDSKDRQGPVFVCVTVPSCWLGFQLQRIAVGMGEPISSFCYTQVLSVISIFLLFIFLFLSMCVFLLFLLLEPVLC